VVFFAVFSFEVSWYIELALIGVNTWNFTSMVLVGINGCIRSWVVIAVGVEMPKNCRNFRELRIKTEIYGNSFFELRQKIVLFQ
jgi:hypothetical protein